MRAISGFVILNDWSTRDTQWEDTWHGTFGGVTNFKTFAGSIGSFVVTVDEVLHRWAELKGRAFVNGELWCKGTGQNPHFSLDKVLAYAAKSETLYPGDVISSGTFPGYCGIEIGRFVGAGDQLRLEIVGVGSLENQIGGREDFFKFFLLIQNRNDLDFA